MFFTKKSDLTKKLILPKIHIFAIKKFTKHFFPKKNYITKKNFFCHKKITIFLSQTIKSQKNIQTQIVTKPQNFNVTIK